MLRGEGVPGKKIDEGKGLQAPGGMEEAYSGENRRGGALEKVVHGEGLRRRQELRGGLEGASQKLGSGAKWVRVWM